MANKFGISARDIELGKMFSTALPNGEIIEENCEIISELDEFGNFIGIDSDGVECTFSFNMVKEVGE